MVHENRDTKLLGLGLDNEDGHTRVTRGDCFHLVGGSKSTHEAMQEKCVKFSEKLADRGKRLAELEKQEFLDLAGECEMNVVMPRDKKDE